MVKTVKTRDFSYGHIDFTAETQKPIVVWKSGKFGSGKDRQRSHVGHPSDLSPEKLIRGKPNSTVVSLAWIKFWY